VPRTRRVENLRHGALTTTAGTREGSTITVTASPHPTGTPPRRLCRWARARRVRWKPTRLSLCERELDTRDRHCHMYCPVCIRKGPPFTLNFHLSRPVRFRGVKS
jgi:hypothetical protein